MRKKIKNSIQALARLVGIELTLARIHRPIPTERSFRDTYIPAVSLWMHLDRNESLDRCYAENIVDEECIAFLRDNLSDQGTFVDLGANQGFYSLVVLNEFPNARIIAIEPDPYSLAKLKRNIDLNNLDLGRICISEVAAGTTESTIDLMLNVGGNRAASSVVIDQRRWTGRSENVVVTVPSVPLVDILQRANVLHVSVLKADIEGFEFPVLERFFKDAPSSLYPKAIIVEAFGHLIPMVNGSVLQLIFSQGYRLVRHDQLNFMFVRGN